MKSPQKASWICAIVLTLLFSLSLYIRVALPYDGVFGGSFVRFGGNDPWYNMRLVENTLHNFPHRIYYDAFTGYPTGKIIPFAPLFDYLLAVIIWIIGLGNPYVTLGQQGIDTIGAWYPAVFGALTILPVYFIGKEVWGRNAGLFAAGLITILPGPFLSRSMLGFVDHHVAETLLSTIAMLFFILAINAAKNNEITFESILKKDWASLKKPMIYSIFAGISLGSFYLSWKGAPLFVFILIVYGVVQYVIDHLREESTNYLCIVAVPAFTIALMMIIPIPHIGAIAGIQSVSLLLGIVVFVILSGVSALMICKKIESYWYPIGILTLGVFSIVSLSILNPALYSTLTSSLHIFVPSGEMLTVAEIHPMRVFATSGGLPGAKEWFSTPFFIAFAGFAWLGYNIVRKFRVEEILIVVWSVIILFACFGQNRFAAYYAVNVALLCGLVSWKIIEFVGGFDDDRKERASEERKVKRKTKGGASIRNVKKVAPKKTSGKIMRYVRADLIITVLVVGLVVFYPPLNISLSSARGGGGPSYDWYESLSWMKENTPDTGVDYYALYEEPPLNKTTNGRDKYDYPESVYSVMSWWDYGHWITRIAHRIPVANPFQQGATTAAEYLIETDERKANEILDEYGTKYVITDFLMVDFMGASYHPKYVMPMWAKNNPDPWLTIEVRLHMFDGSETPVESGSIPCLQHYRLVHESGQYVVPFMVINSETGRTLGWNAHYGNYPNAKSQCDILYGGARITGQKDRVAYTPSFITPVSFVKIFEYVEGAKIRGGAPNGSVVEISTNVTTNQGREFVYLQQIVSNGTFEFIVPYSTEEPIAGGTNFDIFASPYKLRVNGVETEIYVPEVAVMEGKTINVEVLH